MSNKEGGTTFHIPQHATKQAKINKEERDGQDYIEEYVDKIQRGAKEKRGAMRGCAVFYGYQSAIAVFFNYGHQRQHGKFFPRHEQHIL